MFFKEEAWQQQLYMERAKNELLRKRVARADAENCVLNELIKKNQDLLKEKITEIDELKMAVAAAEQQQNPLNEQQPINIFLIVVRNDNS